MMGFITPYFGRNATVVYGSQMKRPSRPARPSCENKNILTIFRGCRPGWLAVSSHASLPLLGEPKKRWKVKVHRQTFLWIGLSYAPSFIVASPVNLKERKRTIRI